MKYQRLLIEVTDWPPETAEPADSPVITAEVLEGRSLMYEEENGRPSYRLVSWNSLGGDSDCLACERGRE